MQMKIHKLVTVRTVRETVTHEVALPENIEGDDLLAIPVSYTHLTLPTICSV